MARERTTTEPRHRRMRRWLAAAALVFTACGTSTSGPAPQDPGDGIVPSPVAAPPVSEPGAGPAGADAAWRNVTERIVITPAQTGAPGWTRAFVIPYGEEDHAAGNGLMVSLLEDVQDKADYGPSLATVDGQGRWWVADVFKSRIARYAADGTYLDSIAVEGTAPLEALEVFDDGTAVGTTADRRWLVIADDRASTVAADHELVFAGNDGTSAYGWSLFGSDVEAITVGDGRLPAGREVRWFAARDGSQFGIDFAGDDQIVVTLPDQRIRVTLDVLADTGQPVFASAEFDSDRAGNVHLLVLGHVTVAPTGGDEPDERYTTRAAHVVLSPTGDVLANRPVPDPYGEWDYGVPQRFTVRPDTGTAHIVTVQPDGVHIWQSTAAFAAVRSAVQVGFPSGS